MTILLHRRRREKLYASIYRNSPATRLRPTRRNSPPAGCQGAEDPGYFLIKGIVGGPMALAAHESPRTTKLYDRTGDEITLDEVERITI
jgi:hypothetical protein